MPTGGDAAPAVREEASELDDTLHGLREKYRPADFTGNDEEPPGVAHRNEFPAKLTKYNPYDETAALKVGLIKKADSKNGATPFGVATLSDKDLQWLEQKRQAKQYYNLTRFIDNYFNMKDPINVRFVQEIYPEYFERRKAVIDEQADLQHRVALMRLYGPKSKEDLITLYGIYSGAVPLPKAPLFRPELWYGAKTGVADYNKGLFSIKKIFSAGLPAYGTRHDMDVFPAAESPTGGYDIKNAVSSSTMSIGDPFIRGE